MATLKLSEGSVISMATTIAHWGNNQAIRLTKAEAFLKRFGAFQGAWRVEEADTGAAVGKEQFDAWAFRKSATSSASS